MFNPEEQAHVFSSEAIRMCCSLPDDDVVDVDIFLLVDGGDSGRLALCTISCHLLGHSTAMLSSRCRVLWSTGCL